MSDISRYYVQMKDGTIKHINPFTGTEVWSVPGRASKPITNSLPKNAKSIEKKEIEDYCNFCLENFLKTPPEEARIIKENGLWKILRFQTPPELYKTTPEFRRLPNLFEIISFDYWEKNYGYFLPDNLLYWKNKYLSSPGGKEHIISIINDKLRLLGKSEDEINKISNEEKEKISNAFFGGTHEIIVAKKHYKDNAKFDSELCSSGDLSSEEHYYYLYFTIDALKNVFEDNRYVRYVSIFQNWLSAAGASFDHLHKQIVALDEWGSSAEQEVEKARQNQNIYNEKEVNIAGYLNLIIAENEHAIAFSGLGHRFPTIAIYSKSKNCRPQEHTEEEIRGFSDLVYACHKALTDQMPTNEEWFYAPIDTDVLIPWHVLIKWRINNPAGFEGGTRIFINPISPEQVRDKTVKRLYELRYYNEISKDIKIATECKVRPNVLNYNKR